MVNQVEQTVVDPEVTNFALGYPSSDLLPDELLARQMASYQSSPHRKSILQYGSVAGYEDFRTHLSNFVKIMSGRDVDPDRLFVTNGISAGLHLACSLLAQTGDLVFVEDASYFIGIRLFQSLGLEVETVASTTGGVDFDQLESLLKKGRVPKIFYMIPFNHNPRGYDWSESGKQRLIDLSERYGFHILSDEVYEYLHFSERHPYRSFHDYPNTRVVSLNTFSKILAPGLRLGWIEASQETVERLKQHPVIVSGGGVNPLGCLLVENLLEYGLIDHLRHLRQVLSERRSAMIETLGEVFGDTARWTVPSGGYFVWVEFPSDQTWISDQSFMDLVLEKYRVKFQPGINFNLSRSKFQNCLRLSFSYYRPEQIRDGLRRLGEAHRAYQQSLSPSVLVSPAGLYEPLTPLMVHGHRGRMGGAIMKESLLAEQLGFRLIGLERDLSNLLATGVVIDVTTPEGLGHLLSRLSGQALIVGTTGELPRDSLQQYQQRARVSICSNFSQGIRLLKEMLKQVDDSWRVDLVELHHDQKRDNPSGTALDLAKTAPHPDRLGTISGIRAGSNYGEHIVFLQRDGEKIELRHQCLDRKIFGQGAIRLAKELC
jgi:DNA-binding transcriptional MocR family regulator